MQIECGVVAAYIVLHSSVLVCDGWHMCNSDALYVWHVTVVDDRLV